MHHGKSRGKVLQELRGECINFLYSALKLAHMIVVTRCHILRLKCTKFDFGWGSALDPIEELTALPDPLTGFKGSTSRGGEGIGSKERGGGYIQPPIFLSSWRFWLHMPHLRLLVTQLGSMATSSCLLLSSKT